MKRRINTQLADDDAPENLLISYSTRHTGEQFYKALDACLDTHQDTKLVIIDVLQKIRTPKEVGLTEYGHDYKDVGPLKKIADTHGVTMLVITHTRKTKDSNDKWNEIIGGTGVTSVADRFLMARFQNCCRCFASCKWKILFPLDPFLYPYPFCCKLC